MATVPGTYLTQLNSIDIATPTIPITSMVNSNNDCFYDRYVSTATNCTITGTTTVGDLWSKNYIDIAQAAFTKEIDTTLSKYLYQPMTASTMESMYTNATNVSTKYTGWISDIEVSPNYYNNTMEVSWKGIVDYAYQKEWAKESKKQEIRNKLKNNLLIQVKSRADSELKNLPENEQVAIETLREEISESQYRKYIKDGFILVEAESGKTYQIFRNKWHTKVWRGGKLIEEVCVRISSDQNVPPTDNVLAFMTMIRANEEEFRKLGNVYKMAA